MKENALHLNILFGTAQPEPLLHHIIKGGGIKGSHGVDNFLEFNANSFSERAYRHYGRMQVENTNLTEDELLQRGRALDDWEQTAEFRGHGGHFRLLAQYAKEELVVRNHEFLCHQDGFMEWRELSLRLGQDMFTCAFLAERDIQDSSGHMSMRFDWPAVLRTDNSRLQQMLNKGIAENHFHLNGSTQIFSITWAYLMNHPENIAAYCQLELEENLKGSFTFGVGDNQLPWRTRLYVAAWIRARLYRLTQNNDDSPQELREFRSFYKSPGKLHQLKNTVELLRYFAARLKCRSGTRCLDYAIAKSIKQYNSGAYRLLAGERYFLYQCFRGCLSGAWSAQRQDLLYLYLLVKLRFREELIQANGRKGFRNFSEYQDRKATIWGDDPIYWDEAYRMSIAGTLENGTQTRKEAAVQSLELRIMPSNRPADLLQSIKNIDESAEYALCDISCPNKNPDGFHITEQEKRKQQWLSAQNQSVYFYTIHFGKKPLKRMPYRKTSFSKGVIIGSYFPEPRNENIRMAAEVQAKAIGKAMKRNNYLCSRIRAIDACSHEVGCRPETFATMFRFLRNLRPEKRREQRSQEYQPYLSVTFHAGEDFLDLADGLRAIDEAICFLNMQRGERIGHAMALGLTPQQYYQARKSIVMLPCQDLLDNLVWLLYRSLEWNVPMQTSLREKLKRYATTLLQTIYGECHEESRNYDVLQKEAWPVPTLDQYYEAWKLRGDDPSVYKEAQKTFDKEEFQQRLVFLKRSKDIFHQEYECAKIDTRLWEYGARQENSFGQDYLQIRQDRFLQRLLYRYHYGVEERQRGQRIEIFHIPNGYVELIERMQYSLMQQMMRYGICVECNPSSNRLIGPIDRYDQHPIFRMNHFGLPLPEYQNQNVQLVVSVNTDDQGVFDTSLENEYALLYNCLAERKNENEEPLFDDDTLQKYLNHLREMGLSMIFPKAQQV